MKMMNTFELYLAPAGRILVGAYFLISGLEKVADVSSTAGYIASVGLPAASGLAVLAIFLEIGAGGALIIGYKAKYAALALAAFVVLVSFIFHEPSLWSEAPVQRILFMKNMALFGSLLFIGAHAGMAAKIVESKNSTAMPTIN